MPKRGFNIALIILLSTVFFTHISAISAADQDNLIARGEHRIEIQRYGRSDPEVSIDIMQSNFYNDHHEDYVIRIEDLNKTINKEINEEVNKEYNQWFNDKFNSQLNNYVEQQTQAQESHAQEMQAQETNK